MRRSLRLAGFLFVTMIWAFSGVCLADGPLFQIRALAEPESDSFETFTLKDGGKEKLVRVNPTVWLDESAIDSVTLKRGAEGEPCILITFTETATKRWGILTTNSVGKRIGILLMGRLVSTPGIRQPLFGSSIEVSGGFSQDEAEEFMRRLEGGK